MLQPSSDSYNFLTAGLTTVIFIPVTFNFIVYKLINAVWSIALRKKNIRNVSKAC